MEEIVKFKACDGKVFDTKGECLEREKRVPIDQMISGHTCYNEFDSEGFIDELLSTYTLTLKSPQPPKLEG